LGTVLSGFARIAGQKINTNNTKCVQCNKCNETCPMSIDIKGKAINGKVVQDIRCVGCGHCIDECPTMNLSYSTRFTERIKYKKHGRISTNNQIDMPRKGKDDDSKSNE
jgi:ferredoxin-type protein NapH